MTGYDVLIRRGLLFDGRGGQGVVCDVALKDGKVAALSRDPLDPKDAAEVVEAVGLWVTPGFIDMHSHYDAEVEIAPELSESTRHGVTTVLLGSCSLSMVLGNPSDLADMFCRVEGIPREVVLPLFETIKDWDSPKAYLEHLETKRPGPNVACLLGHSTLRAAAMGLGRSTDWKARPTEAEFRRMEGWIDEALDEGFVGMSISTLPWDKMDGEEFRSRPMPSVFATWREYARLSERLRARGAVLQAVPNISTKLNVPLFALLSAGLWRKRLKTTLIAMMDVRADRLAFRLAGGMARLFNRFFDADFKMQALPEAFDLWADGIDLVVFEEFEAGAAALHLADPERRAALLRDPAYRARFRRQWKRKWLPRAYHRDFNHSKILACPDAAVVGKSFAELGRERGVEPVDAFLDLVLEHGRALRWYTVLGNDRPQALKWIVSHPDILIGFSDAGAHLRNMAHYNFPMRLLKTVRDAERAGRPFMTVGRAVQRLSSEIADWLGLDAGVLAPGRAADVVVIDPRGLDACVEEIHEAPMPGFPGLDRLVRRNDAAVRAVYVNGKPAGRGGRVLRAGAPRTSSSSPARPASDTPRTPAPPTPRTALS